MIKVIPTASLTTADLSHLHHLDPTVSPTPQDIYFLLFPEEVQKNLNLLGFAILSVSESPVLESIFIQKGERFNLKGTRLLKKVLTYCAQNDWNSLALNSQKLQQHPELSEFFVYLGFELKEGTWLKTGLLMRKQRFRRTLVVLLVTLVVNTFLTVIKLIAGVLSGSQGAIADGIQTLMDNLNSFMLFITSYVSYHEADRNHPFGHANIEHIVSLMIGTWLIGTSLSLAYESIKNFWNPKALTYPFLALGAIGASVVIKGALYLYKMRAATQIKDASLRADAIEHRADVFSSLGVLTGIALSYAGYPWADSLAGLIVSLFIARECHHILKESVDRLMNRQEEAQIKLVRETVNSCPEVHNVHDIRVKYDGNQLFVFMNVRLDRKLSLIEAHQIAHAIERKVKTSMTDVQEVFVHSEPTMK